MAQFSGLYYPGESWDLEIEDSMLKKCLLFFDKIYAIVPDIFSVDWKSVKPYEELDPFLKEARLAQCIMDSKIASKKFPPNQEQNYMHKVERHDRITRFLEKTEVLRNEGVLEIVDPRENIIDPPYWDRTFQPTMWGDINPSYEMVLQKGLSLTELEAYKPHILYGSILYDIKNEGFRKLAAGLGNNRVVVYKGQAEWIWLTLLGKLSGFEEDKTENLVTFAPLCGTWSGTVSTPMWASLVLNHALLTSHKYYTIPATSSNIFWELLQYKLHSTQSLLQCQQLNENYMNHPEYKAGFTGFSLAACTLPNLEPVSYTHLTLPTILLV